MWNIVCIFCSTPAPCLKAFALTGRDWSNTRYPGCRFTCPGLCAPLGFQPALAKSETWVTMNRIPPNYLVLMPILNTLPHNARLPQHVVSAVSHRLLCAASITKNTSSAATHTINAHFVQSTPICLWQSAKSCIFAASKYIMTSKVSKIEALSSYREIAMWKFLFFSWGTVWCLFICFIYASP